MRTTILLGALIIGVSRCASSPPATHEPNTRGASESHALPEGCVVKKALELDLDHDGKLDGIRWLRCERLDRVELDASGRSFVVYENRDEPELESMFDLRPVELGPRDTRALVNWSQQGTGNIHEWKVVDVANGALRSWDDRSLEPGFAPLLAPGESVGKQYADGVVPEPGGLVVMQLVYREGEPNCCPSGGLVKARLVAGATGLSVAKVWREPLPESNEK